MSYLPLAKDVRLEVPRGLVGSVSGLNKFGRAPNGVQTTATDVWDRADATPTQQIWVAPTAARLHDIASTSTSDDGSPAGVGARTIRVYGLTGWGAAEVNEDITMDGTSNVTTANSYVIIHRMKVLTKGATNTNVGVITATAQTDSTVTAQINAGEGQTQMAIYGVPSTHTLYLTSYYFSLIGQSAAGSDALVKLLVNPEPSAELLNFLTKHTNGVESVGSSHLTQYFNPYFAIAGPAIVKLQAEASAADIDGSGGFDGYLVTN